MKKHWLNFIYLICWMFPCSYTFSQSFTKVVFDENDPQSGYYLAVVPEDSGRISGVLFLLAGFGQSAESISPETKLHNIAYANNLLTICYGAGNKLYADAPTQIKLTRIMKDIISRYNVKYNKFVLGGYSAGGAIAMRYVEFCNEHPDQFPIVPQGVFTVDSPLDIFACYDQLELNVKNEYSDIAVEEGKRAMEIMQTEYGVPRENVKSYSMFTPFSMLKAFSENEKYLKYTPVRAYHDVDISWWIKNRNQTVHGSNYEMSAELINRLNLMGNKNAEFIQSFQTGFRSNGQRHPHSWSIVNEIECIQWVKSNIK